MLLIFEISTGLRAGEIRAITWNDIDFEKGLVHVTKQLNAKNKVTETKTKTKRFVPVEISLVEMLKIFK